MPPIGPLVEGTGLGLLGMAALGSSTSKEHRARRNWPGDAQLVRCRLLRAKSNLDVSNCDLPYSQVKRRVHRHSIPGKRTSATAPRKAARSGYPPISGMPHGLQRAW
jgi:hypothetical protein